MIMMDSDDSSPYLSLINNIIRPPIGTSNNSVCWDEYPKAILTCHQNSHPFNNRTLNVSTPIKIGRAVNKCKASNNNAIFDCKVLSRNHALIWYEQGKFYLQDTKSSNGTFVNKERLSVANSDSAPREIFSGDTVQFGVDVTENNRKVTHGCIIATLALYHPSGDEVANRDKLNNATGRLSDDNCNDSRSSSNSHIITTITTGQLLQLSSHLKEALKREESLEAKIQSLEAILAKTCQSSAESWKSCVEEDRLLARIEALQFKLESLLTAFSIKTNDDTVTFLRNEVVRLHDLKEKYEMEAKESVLHAQQSVCVAKANICELEISLNSAMSESQRLADLNMGLTGQLSSLSEKYDGLINDLEEMDQKLQEAKSNEELLQRQSVELESEKYELSLSYEEKIGPLKARIESLEDEITRLRKTLDECNSVDNIKNLSNLMVKSRPISPLVIDDNRNESDQESFRETNHGKNLTNGIIIDNEPHVFSGTSKKSINDQLHVSSSPQPPSSSPSSPNVTSQLKHEINLLKELVEETKTAKQGVESRVQLLELDLKKMKSEAFHSKEDAKKSNELLAQAKEKMETTNKTVETLLKELNNVQGQLKLSRDEVNSLHQALNRERIKSSTAITQTLQTSSADSEKMILLSQVDSLTRELGSVKDQLTALQIIRQNTQKEVTDQVDEPDDGPKTLVLDGGPSLSEKELAEKESELLLMRQKYEEIELKSSKLEEQVGTLKEDLELANYQNRIAFTCASVPLLMLILAIFAAFHPFFSSVTATHDSGV